MSTSPIHTLHIMWAVFAQLLGLAHKVHSHRGVYLVQNWLSSLGNFEACGDDELLVNENARGKVVCVCVCVSNKSCIAFKYGTIEGEFSWHFFVVHSKCVMMNKTMLICLMFYRTFLRDRYIKFFNFFEKNILVFKYCE